MKFLEKPKSISEPKNDDFETDYDNLTNIEGIHLEELTLHDGWQRYLIYVTKRDDEESKERIKQVYYFPREPFVVTIGRAKENVICIDDKKLSRNHAKIESKDGMTCELIDMGSSGGIKVNSIRETCWNLKHGDKLKMGRTKFEYRVKSPKQRARASSLPEQQPFELKS